MLNIYYGRESIDKEKFIFESIAGKEDVFVLVPDQYTLQAEKEAFHILDGECLMNMEILSISRLGSRILKSLGGDSKTFIDKYGRHMLLAQILKELDDKLEVFSSMSRKNSFIELVNNFISEMKQYNITPDMLAEVQSSAETGILSRKLADMRLIFERYEERIKGKYTDTEDYIELYKSRIAEAGFIKKSSFWIYGFDSFSPKVISVIGQLIEHASEVNVVLTYARNCPDEDLFGLSEIVMSRLKEEAKSSGRDYNVMPIGDSYAVVKHCEAIEEIEKQLFSVKKYPSEKSSGLTMVEAANQYNEAESAASYILHLIRDKGLRYRDIVVICNDMETRGSIINRVFSEYGLELFDDKKRPILNSTIAIYLVALLECAASPIKTQELFKLLKTGIAGMNDEEIEQLENYAFKYRINGGLWLKPFTKGIFEYGDDGIAELEEIRKNACKPVENLASAKNQCHTYEEFVRMLYGFLAVDVGLVQHIEELIKEQEDSELIDLADETRQIWNCIVGLFDQIVELMGSEPLDLEMFIELLKVGLSQIEVGVLPQAMDVLMLGTMQRTRSARVKATLVLGANEGILPAGGNSQGLFSISELEQIAEKGRELCKVEKVRIMEERLAIYRNMSKPSDYLWISFCSGNMEGDSQRPSEIVGEIRKIFPGIQIQRDILNQPDMIYQVGGKTNTLRHLSEAIHRHISGEEMDSGWYAVLDWYRENEPEELERMIEGFRFTNKQDNLPLELVKKLYGKETISLSPSRMEAYSRCPFSHFVMYGLRPEERRIFEAGNREIGDMYHTCIMRMAQTLDERNAWETVSEEECHALISQIVNEESLRYREGVFHITKEEHYKSKRLEEIAFDVCWGLVLHARAGQIEASYYEQPFNRDELQFKPIEIETEKGVKVLVEGKIDRVDILRDGVKIIDYKTGNERFDIGEAREGYRLQLMTYLKAGQYNGQTGEMREPAGVFYFLISEPKVNLSGVTREKIVEKISSEIRKSFKLNGIMLNSESLIRDIGGEFTSGASDIIPIKINKEGEYAETGSGFLLSPDEFRQLQADVDVQLQRIADELVEGQIDIRPKRSGNSMPCTYCKLKGICRFDLDFGGCEYEII